MSVTFRNAFLAAALGALILGFFLWRLWQPEQQVMLHSVHLLQAVEARKWDTLAAFLDDNYSDQWGDDRALLLSRLRMVLPYARNLRIEAIPVGAFAGDGNGSWRARITLTADPNELTALMQERINKLDTPFEFRWQQKSWKPWDWRLVRVTNESLELPDSF